MTAGTNFGSIVCATFLIGIAHQVPLTAQMAHFAVGRYPAVESTPARSQFGPTGNTGIGSNGMASSAKCAAGIGDMNSDVGCAIRSA